MSFQRCLVNTGKNVQLLTFNSWFYYRWITFSTIIGQCIGRDIHREIYLGKKLFVKGEVRKRSLCAVSEVHKREERKLIHNQYITNDAPKANIANVNKYTTRTHTCGELRLTDVGREVTLCGWVEFIRMNKFVLLRDAYGTTQVILNGKEELNSVLNNLHLESTVCVSGVVRARPESQVKKNLSTGEVEVDANTINILGHALPKLPFHIRDYNKANEKTLNQYRYLALRFPELQHNLRLRSEMLFKMREFFIKSRNFVEVETPTLFKKTPGGAQEFIVPTHFKNKFYSLVQSPQQLKQLLMVGSIDRYFQVARCYRDERTNTERQPEFTQLDVELSFTNAESVMRLTEEVLAASWPTGRTPLRIPFPRIPYKDALENYGSDKPCLINEFRIQNLSKYFPGTNSKYMFIIPNGKVHHSKLSSRFNDLSATSDVTMYTIKVPTPEKFHQSLTKIFSKFDISLFQNKVDVKNDDLVVLAVGFDKMKTLKMLGLCRHQTIDHLDLIQTRNKDGVYDFFWVVDFPLVELNEFGELVSTHHPFTQPHPDDTSLMSDDILKVRSLAYDLVLNGSEIGGGSIRIHNFEMQKNIFKLLNLDETSFSHLLEALQMGCPPHGGIALGLDRLTAILCNCVTIKDVIAFPKSTDGLDYMTKCPDDIPIEDKIRYHIYTPSTKDAN